MRTSDLCSLPLAAPLLLAAIAASCGRTQEAVQPPPSPTPATSPAASPAPTPAAVSTAEIEQGLREFRERVHAYAVVHERAEKQAPSLPDKADAARIQAHEDALAEAVRKARSGAQEGDVFTPAARAAFAQILGEELRGPGSKPERETIKEGNPRNEGGHAPVVLAVNARYPKDAPLSTMPPSLLQRLPQLPTFLEYRFVGRHLVLRDSMANLLVDVMRDAAPASEG